MKRATDEARRRICKTCATIFYVKPSAAGIYCSYACRDIGLRTNPKNDPRQCLVCGGIFTPSRSHGIAKYCSKPCIWQATKGPAFNAKIARDSIDRRRAAQVGRGDGRAYRKYYGRHEHRVVAERMLGRPLIKGEIVHHIDGNKLNNDPANLSVITQGAHMREHGLGIPGKPLAHEPWKYRGKK